MKRLRTTSIVVLIAWMCGALFCLWLSYTAATVARFMIGAGISTWLNFLDGAPWLVIWVVLAGLLGGLALASARLAREATWVAYAYPVLVVVVLAVLFWAVVVQPVSSQLAIPL